MIAISNANQPSWKTVNVKSYIPESLKPLEELSRNLWWVWNEEAKELFKMLDADLSSAAKANGTHARSVSIASISDVSFKNFFILFLL